VKLFRDAERTRRAAFTLAEVAVTIVIVGITLIMVLQGLNKAKLSAAQTRNLKLARELALATLGRIESGVYWEDVDDDRIEGTYAEEGYPNFIYEVVIGDKNFRPDENDREAFDNWRQREKDEEEKNGEKDEDAEEPYEKLQIKVVFPQIQDWKNELVLEKWLPWKQVHPSEEDAARGATSGDAAPTSASNSGSTTQGSTAAK
jgi:hypothetical protein